MRKQAVKIGTSRQVVIPKRIHDELALNPGDYLAVETRGRRVIFTPQNLIDREIAKGLEDVQHARVSKTFDDVEKMIAALKAETKKRS
jgi:AbrB family looped-hinge helix DNA binding protein